MTAPSEPIDAIVTAITYRSGPTMGAVMDRVADFRNPLEAMLTGIALDPVARDFADKYLDTYWSDARRRQNMLDASGPTREVIIGSGFHAAVYAATRVAAGFPRPLVLERGARAGGTFAMTGWPTFYLNSRNRPGNGGLAGDQGANLNYLPGAPVQAAHVSMTEYQTNADMALIIRLTLAQYADVVPNATVKSVVRIIPDNRVQVKIGEGYDSYLLPAGRVIDARGLGDPSDAGNGTTVLTFPQFLQRMAGPWPLRGLRRVAVIGGGDSGKCAVESFLGVAPQPRMSAAALDHVDRVDWYATDLPSNCDEWQRLIRGRYQAIGRYLRPDRFGVRRLNVIDRRTMPVALPDTALIDGRTYDLVVLCTGNAESDIAGMDLGSFDVFNLDGELGEPVARKHVDLPAYRVGPHARLEFTRRERSDGIAGIAANAVSMFRTASKTATLAAKLPAIV